MSIWTDFSMVIAIDTYNESCQMKIDHRIMSILAKAPAITGSEGNIGITCVPQLSGSRYYGKLIYGKCNSVNGMSYKNQETQTRHTLSTFTSLRDKRTNETIKETLRFLKYLARHFHIDSVIVHISDPEKQYLFDNKHLPWLWDLLKYEKRRKRCCCEK